MSFFNSKHHRLPKRRAPSKVQKSDSHVLTPFDPSSCLADASGETSGLSSPKPPAREDTLSCSGGLLGWTHRWYFPCLSEPQKVQRASLKVMYASTFQQDSSGCSWRLKSVR